MVMAELSGDVHVVLMTRSMMFMSIVNAYRASEGQAHRVSTSTAGRLDFPQEGPEATM